MDVIKLRFLRKGDYGVLSGWAQCNCKGPYKRKSEESVSLVDVMAEETGIMHGSQKRQESGFSPQCLQEGPAWPRP